METFENLDLACAKCGQELAEKPSKELERFITDALAVLEEQGLYALFLYLEKDAKELAQKTCAELYLFLQKTPKQAPLFHSQEKEAVFEEIQGIAQNLDKLLLARDLVRQALIYARYHAKMAQKSEVVQKSEEQE